MVSLQTIEIPAAKTRSASALPDPLPVVRRTVRELLVASPAFRALDAPRSRPDAAALRPYTLDVAVDQFLEACRVHA